MKRFVVCFSAILFCLLSAPVSAHAQSPEEKVSPQLFQQPDKSPPRKFVFEFDRDRAPITLSEQASRELSGRGCPVEIRAQHKSNPSLMNAQSKDTGGVAQLIHLTVGNSTDAPAIVSIRVTVHGTNRHSRALPVNASPEGLSDAFRTFELRAGARSVSTDLILQGFTSVQSVSLDAVNFSDGSSWLTSAGAGCSVAPDAMMLVSRR